MAGAEVSPPNCRDERQERKGNTRGVEKPLAAKTVLLVNWQQANTLITKLLYGQEKHWQQSNLHSSGDRTDPALGMLPLPTHTQDRSTPRPRSQAKHEQRLKIIPPSAELLLISDWRERLIAGHVHLAKIYPLFIP